MQKNMEKTINYLDWVSCSMIAIGIFMSTTYNIGWLIYSMGSLFLSIFGYTKKAYGLFIWNLLFFIIGINNFLG